MIIPTTTFKQYQEGEITPQYALDQIARQLDSLQDQIDFEINKAAIERFLSKIEISLNGCINWTAYKDKDGYGTFGYKRGSYRAHRWIYAFLNGPIPEGFVTDHLCRNRSCVNPFHLEIVTPRTNLLRGENHVAKNAAKTACKYGHEFTPENTYILKKRTGFLRSCRTCSRAHNNSRVNQKREWARAKRERERGLINVS
jgi:hypothetical protein